MADPRKPNRQTSWLTKQQMAAVFDVSESYFDREIRPAVPADHIRHSTRGLLFYARGVVDAWSLRRYRRSNVVRNTDYENYVDLTLLELALSDES